MFTYLGFKKNQKKIVIEMDYGCDHFFGANPTDSATVSTGLHLPICSSKPQYSHRSKLNLGAGVKLAPTHGCLCWVTGLICLYGGGSTALRLELRNIGLLNRFGADILTYLLYYR